MRSNLVVPGSRPELFLEALVSAADAISFDLQTPIGETGKTVARRSVVEFLVNLPATHGKSLIARVNDIDSPSFESDVHALVGKVDILNLPKAQSVEDVAATSALLDRLEAEAGLKRRTSLLLGIETPLGLRRVGELAASHRRVVGLQVGYGHMMVPFGIDRFDESAIAFVRLSITLAAATARIRAYDGAFSALGDQSGYRRECESAWRHGCAGKSCIHPSQIEVANAVFMPSSREVERARRILAASAQAQTYGSEAYVVDGEVVDAASVAGAHEIVAMADRYGPAEMSVAP